MAEQDLDQVIESLKRLGSTSKSVAASSRYTPPAGGRAAVTLNDYRLNALRQAPNLLDEINTIAQGKSKSTGGLGTIGKVLIDNPISKTVLGGLTLVDTPRRAVISGVRELVDLLDEDKKTNFSFNDFFSQTKDTTYGFGTAFPMEGWGGRLVGFIGDVALDPLTYASFGASVPAGAIMKGGVPLRTALGAKTVAGAEGRFALARLAKQMGAGDEIVKNIAAKGRIAVPKELAENMGLRRSGIYFFGSKVRAPFSGPIADALQTGLVKTRLGFFSTSTGEKLGQKFALRGTRQQADTSAQRFNLATGRLDPATASATIGSLGAEDTSRAYQKIAMDTAVKYVSPLLQDPDVALVRGSVYRLLDTPPAKWAEKGITPTAQELKGYEKLKAAFKQLHTDVEGAFKSFDTNFTLGEIEDYLPHIATDDALRLMDDLSSPYAKQIRQYLTVNMTDASGSFRSRSIREGAPWFGKPLTKSDVLGGVDQLNKLARERAKLPFDFFETDMEKILSKYIGYYSRQIGTAKYMEDLIKRGGMQVGKTSWELNEDMARAASQNVKEAVTRYSNTLKETYEAGKTVTSTLSEVLTDLTRTKKTVTRPVGALQEAVKDAKAALNEIDPIEVAKVRLSKAQSVLTERMNTLGEEFNRLASNFETESELLSMLRASNDQLIEQHKQVLDSIENLVRFYKEDTSFSGLVNLQEDVMKAVDVEGYIAPQIFDAEGRQLTIGEVYKKLKSDIAELDKEILNQGKRWEKTLELQDKVNDWFAAGGDDFEQIVDMFKDLSDSGRFIGIKTVTQDSVQKLWTGGSVADDVKAVRLRLDPGLRESSKILAQMNIVDVRDIISRGSTTAANLNDLRRAGIWMVARDVVANGGVLPTDPLYLKRLEALTTQMDRAYNVELLLKGGKTSVDEVARGVLPSSDEFIAASTKVAELQSVNDDLLMQIDQLDDDLLRIGIGEEPILGFADPEKAIADLQKRFNDNRKLLNDAQENLDSISSKSTPEKREAVATIINGDFRKLSEDLTDALSLHYINTQTEMRFGVMTEAASLIGAVPDEKMYNNILASVASHDIEAARAASYSVEEVRDVFKGIREKIQSYQGVDKSAFMTAEMVDIFSNPKRLYEAERIRKVFPEFEAVLAKRIGSSRVERLMFNDPEVTRVGGIADTAIRLLQDSGVETFAGKQSMRRSQGRPRTITGTGRQALESLAEERLTFRGSMQSQQAEWDRLYPMINRNLKKLREFADRPTTSEDMRQAINVLNEQFIAAKARASQQSKFAQEAISKVSGSKSVRINESVLTNAMKFGRAFGMAESFDKALGAQGLYAIDSFFADLLGGTKLDVRQGYSTTTRLRRGGKVKLVARANREDYFVNIYLDEAGRYIDADGKLVNGAGELMAEDGTVLMERTSVDGQIVERPMMGRKSSRPTVVVREEESYLSKVRRSAERRLRSLSVLAGDAEYMPIEALKTGSIVPDNAGGFGFDNLVGPSGYANQLDIQASILDEKIQRASKLEKEIAREERRLQGTAKPELTPAQQKRIDAERRLAAEASRRKAGLEQRAIHTRALERKEFNDFLTQLASLSEESAVNMNWNLSVVGPVSGKQAESAYTAQARIYRRQLDVVNDELKKTKDELFRVMRNEPNTSARSTKLRKRIQDLEQRGIQIANDMDEANDLAQQVRNLTDPAQVEAIMNRRPNARFGFNADEWRSLWTAPKSKAEIDGMNRRVAELKAQLSALSKQEEVALRSEFPYNFSPDRKFEIRVQMKEVSDEIERLSNDINMEFVRDNAIKKAKFLHERFSDPQYQSSIGVANMTTIGRQSVDMPVKTPIEGMVEDVNNARRRVVPESKDVLYRATRADSVVGPDVALKRFTKDSGKDVSFRIGDRRKFLRDTFASSDEGKHLVELQQATADIKNVYRKQNSEKLNNWRLSRDSMRKTIASKRQEIKELNIAAGYKELNDIITGAEETVGKLPRIKKGEVPTKAAKKVIKDIDKGIKANRANTKFLRRSEELFGSLEQANAATLSGPQLRRRQLVDQVLNMEYGILGERATQKEVIDTIKELVQLSDNQAADLGLPSKTKIRENLTLASQLEKQTAKVEAIYKGMARTVQKADADYTRLANAVDDARARFNQSELLRKPAEEAVEDAKKAVETVRELARKSVKVGGTLKKKDPAWIAGMDEFLAEVDTIMPIITDAKTSKEVRGVLAAYVKSKAKLAQDDLAVTLAKREEAVYKGIEGLTAQELGALDLPPGAVNIKTQFDEGFVQLSQYFPNIGVRKELAEMVQNVHRLQDPAIVKELSRALSTYTRFFKSYATLSPGFHIRNAFSNFFMMFAAGGRIDFLMEGTKWSRLWSKMSAEGKNFDQFIAAVPEANRAMVRDAFLAAAASGGGMTEDALREGAMWGTKTSRKVGNWLEQHSRFMLAYDGMRQGMDFNTSAARVRRFLIDYENTSTADNFMRQIVPFWMWTSRNLPLQIQNIWMNPKPYQIYGAIKRNIQEDKEGEVLPNWMEEIGAFKLPFGNNLYATPDFGFNRVGQQVQELRDPQRLLSNLNPALRLPIELAGGRQFYSNRQFSATPIEVEGGLSTALQPLLEALGYGETGPDGKKYVSDKAYYAVRNLAPFLGTAERLVPSIPTYQQRGTTNQWLGFLGAPVRENTAAMQEGELKRRKQLLQEFLSKQKAIGVIPEE